MKIVHHAMPDLVGCALRSMAWSRCGPLRARSVRLCGAWAKVGRREIHGRWRDERREDGVYEVVRAQNERRGYRRNEQGARLTELRRLKVEHSGDDRGQQLRFLSSRPGGREDQQSSKKYVPHLASVTLYPFTDS